MKKKTSGLKHKSNSSLLVLNQQYSMYRESFEKLVGEYGKERREDEQGRKLFNSSQVQRGQGAILASDWSRSGNS